MPYKELIAEFKLAEDWQGSGDPWGAATGVLFDICAELHQRDAVPASWLYVNNATQGIEEESYWFEILPNEDTATLQAFGNVLSRYVDKLRVAGYDY